MRILCVFPVLALGCVEYGAFGTTGGGFGTTDGSDSPGVGIDVPDGQGQDSWDLLPSSSSIDVIFYGDTSTSMNAELSSMGQNVSTFIDRMAAFVPDWQLATVTGDEGCAINGILTPETPNYAGLFADAIVQPPHNISGDEMGLLNVALAVEQAVPQGCNEGLIRGGTLHVVFISDENDESPGHTESVDYWESYADRVTAVHGDPSQVVMSAVAGPAPGGCYGAEPGFGYHEAVEATGGEFLSICEDWENNLDILADAGVTRSTFILSQLPVEETIQVWRNAAQVPASDWLYLPLVNAVLLDPPPQGGDRIDVTYELAGE